MFLTIKLCTHAKLNCLNRADNLFKIDLALKTLQILICHKIQTTNSRKNSDLSVLNFGYI